MPRVYLQNESFYVMDEEKYIYKVDSFFMEHGSFIIKYYMSLFAGYDYIDTDISDEQGFVPSNRFADDKQDETFSQYIKDESLEDALDTESLKIVNNDFIEGLKKDFEKLSVQYGE